MPLDVEILDSMRIAATAAVDKKAFHLVALDVSGLTALADGFVFCSAGSERQVEAVVREIERRFKKMGKRPLHIEGEARSEWVLIDFGDFVVHVFTEEKRAYYALESLWGDAPRLLEDVGGAEETTN